MVLLFGLVRYVVEDLECSHYMKDFSEPRVPLRLKGAKDVSF